MKSPILKSVVPAVPALYQRILSIFPENFFQYCFAYGSGVFKQGTTCGTNPMIDLIFSLNNTAGFHRENIIWNPSHYSGLKHFGHTTVTYIQEKWPAKVYFNTLIPLEEENIMLKYGVINHTDLIDDLLDWNYLYLAGRLHKPVLDLIVPTGDLKMALRKNLLSACHSALLILPEYFTERELYTIIAALSYNGDFRMIVGENKNKVHNIVDNQIEYFRRLYRPLLSTFHGCLDIPDGESPDQTCMQDMSYNVRKYHLFQLPKVPLQNLAKSWRRQNITRRKDTEDVLLEVARDHQLGEMLINILSSITFRSSIQQSLKGIFTAGVSKTLTYSSNKLNKMKGAQSKELRE